jgi:uncharacterized membrane protein YphA (DoxX/SURF4 family)
LEVACVAKTSGCAPAALWPDGRYGRVLGGLLLALGLLTPIAAAALIGVMIAAIFTVHAGGRWTSTSLHASPVREFVQMA